MAGLLLSLVCLAVVTGWGIEAKDIEMRMPNVQPKVTDTYLCFPYRVDEDALYVTGFTPHGKMDTAHHILMYTCAVPGVMPPEGKDEQASVWNCGGEMADGAQSSTEFHPVCAKEQTIIYGWGMDAPALTLPKGVGFKVGQSTLDRKWLVVQVHYKDVSLFTGENAESDTSGVTLTTTHEAQPKLASVYLLGTGGTIPPNRVTYLETACQYEGAAQVHPFAFRTHTHTHGEVVSGYRVRSDGNKLQWDLIGSKDPKKPQMFYNTEEGIVVETGDYLAARCTMKNDEDQEIKIGATQKDEMCNFYMMYWVDSSQDATAFDSGYCFKTGFNEWEKFFGPATEEQLNIPSTASCEPETKMCYQEPEQDSTSDSGNYDIVRLLQEMMATDNDYVKK